MYAVLLAWMFEAFTWLFRTVILKFTVYTVLYFVISDVAGWLINKLPSGDGGLASSMSQWSSGTWFFFDYFQLQFGIPAILAATVLRFGIRRLPIIG
jgi:hypothetical protein